MGSIAKKRGKEIYFHNERFDLMATTNVIDRPSEPLSLCRDSLTGLADRELFFDRLKQAIFRSNRDRRMLAVIFLDLDNFKTINSGLGHGVGDILLREVAARLVAAVRDVDTVSRFGGDEFIILLEEIEQEYDATTVARRIIESISNPYEYNGIDLYTAASVGISFYPADGASVDDLVKNADMAMHHAKDCGKNTYQIFTRPMHEKVTQRLEMEASLRKAIQREELLVYYQPKVALENLRIVGMEALLRWRRMDGKIILPGEFIQLAEETGLIVSLDEWTIHEACRFTKSAHMEADSDLPVSVNVSINLSARDLERKDLLDTVVSAVEKEGLEYHHLELEVTESAVIRDLDRAIGLLKEMRDLGFMVSIDDFGTGYSSLNYLAKMPINILKIDRTFVTDLQSNHNARSIARAIISMSHDMGIKVVAEGVETGPQLDYLKRIGCDEVQGYIFCKPLPEREMLSYLKQGIATANPSQEDTLLVQKNASG